MVAESAARIARSLRAGGGLQPGDFLDAVARAAGSGLAGRAAGVLSEGRRAARLREALGSGAAERARNAIGISAADMAAACGVSRTAVGYWESGSRSPGPEAAAAYLQALAGAQAARAAGQAAGWRPGSCARCPRRRAWRPPRDHGRPAVRSSPGQPRAGGAEGAHWLAAVLGIPPGSRDPALAAAAAAYRDAYAEAAGIPRVPPVRAAYLAGQEVVTGSGRTGVLTGGASDHGNPRGRFGAGPEVAVPRMAVVGPLVHVFPDLAAARAEALDARAARDGDILLVPSARSVAVLAQGSACRPGDVPPGARYAAAARMAASLAARSAAGPGSPPGLAALGFPEGAGSAPSARPPSPARRAAAGARRAGAAKVAGQ